MPEKPEYRKRLEALTADQREQWRAGEQPIPEAVSAAARALSSHQDQTLTCSACGSEFRSRSSELCRRCRSNAWHRAHPEVQRNSRARKRASAHPGEEEPAAYPVSANEFLHSPDMLELWAKDHDMTTESARAYMSELWAKEASKRGAAK